MEKEKEEEKPTQQKKRKEQNTTIIPVGTKEGGVKIFISAESYVEEPADELVSGNDGVEWISYDNNYY